MALSILSVAYPFAPVRPDAVGGAEQILAALDRALVSAGHRSIVIARGDSRITGELVPVPVLAGPIGPASRAEAAANHRAAIEAVLARERVDLVHLHGIDLADYLPETAPALGTLHLPLDWYPPDLFAPRPRLWLHAVSPTQHATRPPGARLLAPIANGVPDALFATVARKRGHAVLLARICPEKGVHLALDAAHLAGVPLLIGGEVYPYPSHRRYFEDEVAPRLDRRRRFLGPLDLDRKRRLLASARCALVPSLAAETSSLVTIEALACGTPVIAFPNGALPALIEEGVNGFLVEDVAGMARAIEAAGRLDPAACRASVERFREGRMAARYLARYRALAEQSARFPVAVERSRETVMSNTKMPPVPPQNRSDKGPGEPARPEADNAPVDKQQRNQADKGRQENIRQNTTNQGYQQDR